MKKIIAIAFLLGISGMYGMECEEEEVNGCTEQIDLLQLNPKITVMYPIINFSLRGPGQSTQIHVPRNPTIQNINAALFNKYGYSEKFHSIQLYRDDKSAMDKTLKIETDNEIPVPGLKIYFLLHLKEKLK